MQTNGTNQNLNEEIKEYQDRWLDMMSKIWQDRIELYHAKHTGNLQSSIDGELQFIADDLSSTFRFDFPKYGIYVENAVGNHYVHNNGGDLEFLDPVYRAEHRLDRPKKVGPAWGGYITSGGPRVKKPWMSPSWGISRRVLGNAMLSFLGMRYFGMFDNLK